jgi:hypothetical protein
MRNIREYPITREEVLEVLEKIPMDNPPGTPPMEMMIGGLNDSIRDHVITIVKHDPEIMSKILRAANGETY